MAEIIGAETETRGKLKAIASGTLSNGDTVVVNSDGTVSAVGGSSVSGSTGTPQTFYSAEATKTCVVYDSGNDKIVVAYRDGANADTSRAVVGTISGTTVSFGTPVQFSSDNCFQDFKMAYDSTNGKIVIVWAPSTSPYPVRAIVGTVSGTSISFGTQVNVFAGYAAGGGSSIPRVVYDSTNNKVVVLYRDESASGQGKAVVGTISGTSISFGSVGTFNSSNTYDIDAAFDSGNGKVFIAFRDIGNSNYGTGIVGTVSGTSITFGTKVVFESAEATEITTCYDSANGKVAAFYQDAGNSQYGTYVVGTVSGTSVSFGTPAVIASARREKMSAAYNAVTGKITISWKNGSVLDSGYLNNGTISGTTMTFDTAYQIETGQFLHNVTAAAGSVTVTSYTDGGNSNYGKVVVDQQNYTSTNITATNFIGISSTTVADTETATIDIIGTTNNAQSGLTAGQKYYVQNDGTLSTTAGDPSVLAGTALSATKIVVKT